MNKKIAITIDVPDWAVCLVTEQSGKVYAWSTVPKYVKHAGVWDGPGNCRYIFAYRDQCEDWKESLVMLPQWKEDKDPDTFM